jgi:hypothetical protein
MSGILNEIENSIDNYKITSIDDLSNEFKLVEIKYSALFPNITQK